MQETLSVLLDFARSTDAGAPFAFRFAPQEYLLRGSHGGLESATFPWDEKLLADLSALRRPRPDPVITQRLGETLRKFISEAGFAGDHDQRIEAAVQRGQRVIITIRSAAAELYALPWELVTGKASGQHLGESPSVLVRYEWPETRTTPEHPMPRKEGGRVLVCWSAAGGAVPATEHIDAIKRAAGGEGLGFDPNTDVVPNASLGRIAAALAAAQTQGQPVAILHLLAHGAAVGSTFGLALDPDGADDASQRAAVADAGRLRQVLAPFSATVRLVVLGACDSGNSGAMGNQLGSIAQTLHRAGFAHVVSSRYPLSVSGSIVLTQALYEPLLGQSTSLETAFLLARTRLAQDSGHMDWASLQLYARAEDGDDGRPVVLRPYRGLLAFAPEHSELFFGRGREIAEITQRLTELGTSRHPRLLFVMGASGTGKSSLVLAGVVPRLRSERTLCRMRPSDTPLDMLERALAATESEAPGRKILLVIDQLEELFTHTADAAARNAFSRRLFQLATDKTEQVLIVCTLRVDFLGRCGELQLDAGGRRMDTLAYAEPHRVFVTQLGPEALQEAICQPAWRVGLRLEEGLASRLVHDVGAEPGALPLLSDTLDLLWQQRQGRLLTQAAYDALGGISGALRKRADALVAALSQAAQRLARRLLIRLVSIDEEAALATRRRVTLPRLLPAQTEQAPFQSVLASLLQARLVVTDGEAEAQTIEVSHEALIRCWERLSTWVREDRRMLAELERIEAWTRQCNELGTLLTGPQLGYATEVCERWHEDFPPASHKLLMASIERERKLRRARQGIFAGTAVAAALFAGLGWFSWHYAQLSDVEARRTRDWMRIFAVHELKAEKSADPTRLASLLREVESADPAQFADWQKVAHEVISGLGPAAPAAASAMELRERLWQATPKCLSADERMQILAEMPESASHQAHSCQLMVSCVRMPSSSYGVCLRQFQAQQAALLGSY